jgi:predicted amidohydrolase YtcJ
MQLIQQGTFMHDYRHRLTLAGVIGFAVALSGTAAAQSPTADLIVTGGAIYTVDEAHSTVEAMAIRKGKIVFTGSSAEAQRFRGPQTKIEQLHGRLVLPGLFDSHVHPIGIIPIKVCDLNSAEKTLRELSEFVHSCAARFEVPQGGWLSVHQWNFSNGNQPDADYPTLRAALDKASTTVAVQLLGNDGHHGAFNSIGLARAKNNNGVVVGLSKQTLAGDFHDFTKFVGLDADGSPNGAVNEDARNLLDAPDMLFAQFPDILRARAQLPHLLNAAGITGFMDALVTSQSLELYDALQREGILTARATLAQFYDPERMKTSDGKVDYDGMLASARNTRRTR